MIEQVKPSRILDAALHRRFCGPVLSVKSGHFIGGGLPVPAYTSSVDDAAALCIQVIPGCVFGLYYEPGLQSVQMGSDVGDITLNDSTEGSFRHALLLVGCMLALHKVEGEQRILHRDGRELVAENEKAHKEEHLYYLPAEARAEQQKVLDAQ